MMDFARRVYARWTMTPQERHNLRLANTPLAVISASLGAHPRGFGA
ncbi:putative protein OS=Tsukamurella paurometabola (strain ATCC 8368 / DSM / CCUG 35730 /CIP 100753 / JCM 10117 / KCTC 9821 / NBRC 16120 / NCIMB 702349/ NCTC 13040) OX=521096 GN=Tpau_2498 PE=4 SV=1 [Tsukamurella paurometabola]|uniref:Uncharacterized protein n=1 Tax=Tsukamurella paurometabola (strain ATCC 8368 / DSM 20162 / CCUG 35730 / CIP 100753 / JCM 10117 / KCTC 9821 / NBRC 16120 / NCIMB 702349 / NCTC 13040) TaxID=521096 RepID=D5URP7_TSUPD|nr:hypothetical protein [Tsukamurella paurometabola]ADG79102.1 hypothetical protein Tpau_2498 [Tsukamurella paurometabola DSM 20162]SUP34084.1 Uncharacterised protein [Tsukamurella paurometabola]